LKSNKNIYQNIPIAIIGIGCLFPKSSELKGYWRLIFHGENGITDVPKTHWLPEDYFDKDPKKPDHVYCKQGGFLSPVSFDPTEFGIPPASIEATDTSQLFGLTAAKMALHDSGYGEGKKYNKDRTSVILGITGTQELVIPLSARLGHPKWRKALLNSGISPEKTEEIIKDISDSYVSWQESSFPGLLGNVVAGRICNRLDLGGTNCVIDAACASSMAAIHLAVLELVSGRSDTVLTGGIDTLNDIFMHMCFSKTHVLSPTGDARPFSKDADGTVLGEGVGILVLKRLDDAEKDNDRIYAVIKGIGSSSDGKAQSIYAPKPEGQAKALRMAYRNAGIDPSTIELIEAHGTGTGVGDMVEFQSLSRVFGESNKKSGKWCALGSVKSMIGHTKAAAGAAGIIKTALSLYNKVLPPTLKADEPDPNLKINETPFYLSRASRPWFFKKEHPRRAGVSAFGFGGSNFHLILEEYKQNKTEISWDGSVEIFALSASTRKELAAALSSLKNSLKSYIAQGLPDKEFSKKAFSSRSKFSTKDKHRLLLVIERSSDNLKEISDLFTAALDALEKNSGKPAWNLKNIFYGGPDYSDSGYSGSKKSGKIGFMFPGQGSQYTGMGRDLVCWFPEAFNILEIANAKYDESYSLCEHIYPIPPQTDKEKLVQEETLRRTDIAQPAIGAVSLSMLKTLQNFGVKHDAVCGHSYGELPALYAAGWIDIDTLFNLSIARGNLMASAGRNKNQNGAMLAVKAPVDELARLVEDTDTGVILANRNSPDQGVLAGTIEAVDRADKICREKGYKTIKLPVSAAFHSNLVKDAQKPFAKIVKKAGITPSDIPVFSNTTGKPYPYDPGKAKDLLGKQILCPVNFVSEIENQFKTGVRTFVEIGPKRVLTGLVKSILKDQDFHAIPMDCSSGKEFGVVDLAKTLCHLASIGHHVELAGWEQPVFETRKQLMSIPITGANYRTEPEQILKNKKKSKKNINSIKKEPSHNENFVSTQHINKSDKAMNAYKNNTVPNKTNPDKTKQDRTKNTNLIADALKITMEGLKSIQALQAQTAEAHKKFLETQTEANRALQNMMENTQRLTEASLGLETGNREEAESSKLKTGSQRSEVRGQQSEINNQQSTNIQNPETSNQQRATSNQQPATGNQQQNMSEAGVQQSSIQNNMLEVVSRLTGYPVEMLKLDMDIESDLGIDSIKRVEILSTLEEKMPDLPTISPEIMGSLKTLGQIAEYLTGSDNKIVENAPQEPASQTNQKIQGKMLEVVSRLTGYPVEMLELDMDIESDLGIDSIKRVEILSAIEEKMPDLPSVSPEIMGSLKTLGQIAEYLTGPDKGDAHKKQNEKVLSKSKTDEKTAVKIDKKVVSLAEKPLHYDNKLSIPNGRKVLITDDRAGLSKAIARELASFNIDASVISNDILKNKKETPQAGGLIILPDSEMIGADYSRNNGANFPDDAFLKKAFELTSRVAVELLDSAEKGGAVFATITFLDGAFGFKGKDIFNPLQGGLAGLAKTASIEWEKVNCHAIDISPDWKNNKEIAKAVVYELLNPDLSSPVETGLNPDSRLMLELEPSPHHQGKIDLDQNDVVVITGGARGVTAASALALAKHSKSTLVLLGRSPNPSPEPEWLATINDEPAIKKAILENEFSGNHASPVQLEKSYKNHMANREITGNLVKLEETGSTVLYYSVDVRDSDRVKSILDNVRSNHGPIKGIIHGAGTLKDRLIVEKTLEQFEMVFDTKVKGLKTLLEATKQDKLKYIVLFSSITARFGNRGQADYAMANEVLNKIARHESIVRPDCKVISINWGPWDGGMVSSALKREFARSKIELIPIDSGAICMLYEMMGDKSSPVEVVMGANIMPAKKLVSGGKQVSLSDTKENLSLTAKREIDINSYPVLESHILGGKPVVPFALITEWLGHGALHENPGLFFHGLDDMRILSGIKLNNNKKMIRLMAGKSRKKGSIFEVDVEIRNGIKDGIEMIHSRAKAILIDRPVQPPVFSGLDDIDSKPFPINIEEIYEKILFHGIEFRGIKEIISYSSNKMAARISSAPQPSKWILNPLRSKWLTDPLVLDCAFQMAIIWSFEKTGVVSLPNYTASYRQYRNDFPSDGVTAVLEVKETTRHKIKCDFTFLDQDNVVVALLTGYEAIIDDSLVNTFKSGHSG